LNLAITIQHISAVALQVQLCEVQCAILSKKDDSVSTSQFNQLFKVGGWNQFLVGGVKIKVFHGSCPFFMGWEAFASLGKCG
jgi:hypothetical protein